MARDIDGDPVRVFYGKNAVRAVESEIGRELTLGERRVVEEEGYVADEYLDTKGVRTKGVGQTGDWIEKGFEAAYNSHVARAERKIPGFNTLPEYVQNELIQSEYRGDLGGSPTAIKHFNAGRYEAAADEFLNHREFMDPATSTGIKARIQATSDAMRRYGHETTQQVTQVPDEFPQQIT